jgi:hypothetical protein
MTRNHSQFSTEEKMQALAEFENKLILSSPSPRENFQQELAQLLLKEFEQHRVSTPGIKPPMRFTVRLLIAVIVTLTIGVGAVLAVNAILQQFISRDAGLHAVFTAGGGIELNQSQTVGNYTVNLEWANADNNRLTLGFTVSGLVCSTDYMLCDIGVKVFDQNGQQIPTIDGRTDESQSIHTHLYNFDLSSHAFNETISIFQLQITPYGMTNEGPDPDQPNVIRGHTVILSEPIMLHFSVPISGEVRVYNTPQSDADGDITITLRRVVVSPSQTRVAICFVPPVSERSWTTIPSLTTNGAEVVGGGTTDFVSEVGEANSEICNEHLYNAAMFDYRGNWQLEITELVGFGSGGGNDQTRIAGSWVFDFVVP